MVVPPGYSEESVLAVIDRVAGVLAPKFVYGFYAVEDTRQQARVYALEALAGGKFNPALPLENFLFVHVRNQLLNLKRSLYRRSDSPCRPCHDGRPCGPDGQKCQAYVKWDVLQTRKANMLRPLDLGNVTDADERAMRLPAAVVESAEFSELRALIDAKLPVELRADYLKLLDGEPVPKSRQERIRRTVAIILASHGLDPASLGYSPEPTRAVEVEPDDEAA